MSTLRVIVVGGGFGGLNAVRALKNTPFEILLIDKTNHHLFQPLLYEVATAALSPGEIATPIREIFRNRKNVRVIMGEVVAIDKENKTVTLANQDTLFYDVLILSPGASHSYFGKEEWSHHAPGLKTVRDALNIREQILLSFEKAERIGNPAEASPYLNFVIVGGGPTGVEMAGAIAEIAYKTMFKNFRIIRPETSQIFLIEAAPFILPTYPEKLSKRAENDLKKMGVTVLTKTKVTEVHPTGVQIEERFISSRNIIWAAGNQASALLKTLDTPLDRQGRVQVDPDLSLPDYPEIFVIGDAACLLGKNQKPLPGIAPVAIQQGRFVANLLKKEIPKEKRKSFRYRDKGFMATIGKWKAVCIIGKLQLSGFFAWLLWCFVHIAYLIGFRNRLSVLLEWLWCIISGQRGVRLIYRSIDPELSSKREGPVS
jgi:NADH:ubiquinone reductase (H+-translocating)